MQSCEPKNEEKVRVTGLKCQRSDRMISLGEGVYRLGRETLYVRDRYVHAKVL